MRRDGVRGDALCRVGADRKELRSRAARSDCWPRRRMGLARRAIAKALATPIWHSLWASRLLRLQEAYLCVATATLGLAWASLGPRLGLSRASMHFCDCVSPPRPLLTEALCDWLYLSTLSMTRVRECVVRCCSLGSCSWSRSTRIWSQSVPKGCCSLSSMYMRGPWCVEL